MWSPRSSPNLDPMDAPFTGIVHPPAVTCPGFAHCPDVVAAFPAPPVTALTICVAFGSCFAYAFPNADRCIFCATTVSGIDCQPGTCSSLS